MFFVLSKILSFLIKPLVWGLLCLIFALFSKSDKKRKKLVWISFIILYLFSNQAIFFEVNNAWEVKPIPEQVLNQKMYEVVIILGGISSYDYKNESLEFNANSDRLLKVLPLYFSGQVKKILFSGGSGRILDDARESHYIRDYLIDLGVSPKDIIIEDQSRNTYENAKFSVEKLQEENLNGFVLLSTSSRHMYRSKLCFDKLGVDVQVFPTDQITFNRQINPNTLFIPDPQVLDYWYNLIHEWVGIGIYKLKGYC